MTPQSGPVAAQQQPELVSREEIAWGPGPDAFPPECRFCVLHGDPSAEGVFTVRLKADQGCVFAPHSHPHDENLTIVSGALLLGNGSKLDRANARLLGPGSYIFLPKEQFHYAWATEDGTVFQVHATGPFGITYANPEDDPRNQKIH